MKGVRFTKAEREFLERYLTVSEPDERDASIRKVSGSILSKLRAAVEAPKGVDIRPMEAALVKAARGKVIELEGGHAVASTRATAMKVTEEQVVMVGVYMARQNWLTSPMTILDVFNKWYQWLPKARATEPPPSLPAGLGTDGTGQGPAPAGQATKGRRQAPGLR